MVRTYIDERTRFCQGSAPLDTQVRYLSFIHFLPSRFVLVDLFVTGTYVGFGLPRTHTEQDLPT